jgi:7,8-dihydropterin-6-yl-methyl-4-(beta-D-ribofuranosyl)aminobenzene 5'-phosphate synthase
VRRVLFDVGPRADTLFRNADRLGIALEKVDAIVLSHCHFDHTAALAGFLKHIGRPIPVYGHPALFRPCFVVAPEFMDYSMSGDNSRPSLEAAGARFILSELPSEPAPGLLLTGEVTHSTDFEEQGGVSCFTIDNRGETVPDRLEDDVSAVVNVRGLGLVVLSGCSHAGIVNIVKQAKHISGGAPFIAPMHCTGLIPTARLAEAYPGAFRELHVGDEATFKAA